MIQQAEGLKYDPSLMLIDDADRPAKWYFALKQARLDSLQTANRHAIPWTAPSPSAGAARKTDKKLHEQKNT